DTTREGLLRLYGDDPQIRLSEVLPDMRGGAAPGDFTCLERGGLFLAIRHEVLQLRAGQANHDARLVRGLGLAAPRRDPDVVHARVAVFEQELVIRREALLAPGLIGSGAEELDAKQPEVRRTAVADRRRARSLERDMPSFSIGSAEADHYRRMWSGGQRIAG